MSTAHYNADYFAWQDQSAGTAAREGAAFFQPHIRPTDSVVDFGCGGGHLLAALQCAARTGVEPNAAARAAAGQRGIPCVEHAAELPDAGAEVIISSHALEHCPHPLQELLLLHQKLKPGGKALFVVPSEPAIPYRPGDINQHLYTWNAMTLGNLFATAGFKVIAVKELRHRLPPKTLLLAKALPRAAFSLVCRMWGRLSRQRQVMIVAQRKA